MTPQETADTLVYKMRSVIENSGLHALFDYDCFKLAAINCSIIMVKELMEENCEQENKDRFDFWDEVLTELKKAQ